MWLIPYIRNVVNLYLQHSTLRFKCVQKIHSRISVLIKWMAFIIWKLFFPSSSANYEDLFLILKIKFCSQGLWQSSSQLSLRSQHLWIKGGIVSSGRALWNGRCSLTAPSEISAKMWALNCLIIVIFTLFNFLALFQTCGVASGSCDQSAQYRRDTGDWRESREGSTRHKGEAGGARVPWSGEEVDVVSFLSSLNPVEVVKEGKSRLISEVHSKRIWGESCNSSRGNSGQI